MTETMTMQTSYPMYGRCPNCGAELHRVDFAPHEFMTMRGHGLVYWQFCHRCTWMGPPHLYRRSD